MDAHKFGSGADDDRAGAGTVLRRAGAEEKCDWHHDAELCADGGGDGAVGAVQFQPGIWIGE